MKSFKELKKHFESKDFDNVKIIDEDQVIIVKDKKENKETVFFYYSYKDLQNPEFIINTAEKYAKYKHHAILTYVGFSSEVFDIEGLNFKAKININNIEKLCCLGVHELKMSLLFLKLIDSDTYSEILKKIAKKIKEKEKIYTVIPYGLETEPTINADLINLLGE